MSPLSRTTLLERMWLVRAFDEAAGRLSRLGEVPGVIHLTIGQEATVVGACAALAPDDYMVGNHRGHGHTLAKGADPGQLLAELLGKESGVCRGLGGSQHVAEPDVGNVVGSAVLGSGVPVGVGFAFASQVLEQGRVRGDCDCRPAPGIRIPIRPSNRRLSA